MSVFGGDAAIQARGLVKVYHARRSHPVRALDRIDLAVGRGEIFGLLGRNGAGKTTLLRILTTLIRPTEGAVSILGLDVTRHPYEVRTRICAVLQEQAVEVFLSVQDNLETFARFHGLSRAQTRARIGRAVEQFGLEEYRRQKVIDLSGGAKRRVQVAKAFMVDTPVVFLDEPTTGMDPITKRATLDAIREQAEAGRTVFLTTHILQEAEELCSTIALIDRDMARAKDLFLTAEHGKVLSDAAGEVQLLADDVLPNLVDGIQISLVAFIDPNFKINRIIFNFCFNRGEP